MRAPRAWVGLAALYSGCSNPTGLELVIDYPSHASRIEVASSAFEGASFDLEPSSGAIERLEGTVLILLRDELAGAPIALTVSATGDGGLALVRAIDATPERSEVVEVPVRIEGCGDGETLAPESCDDGNAIEADGCSAGCAIESTCGDGILGANEGCDDGDLEKDDGCSPVCTVEPGFECSGAPSVCNPTCTPPCMPECGDGLIQGEACDDGDTEGGDGCDPSCAVEAGYTCSGEPSVCQRCGNGRVEASEGCDDGDTDDGDGCSATCTTEPGWVCSDGQGMSGPSQCEPICGDGILLGAACDDGDLEGGDGCSASCTIEPACQCAGEPSQCQCCGNEIVEATEACDDGDVEDGDGCDRGCRIETGFGCINYDPSICFEDDDTTFVDGTSASCPGDGTRAAPFCLLQTGIQGTHETVVVFTATYPETITISGLDRRVLAEPNVVVDHPSLPLNVTGGAHATIHGVRFTTPGNGVIVSGSGTELELIGCSSFGATGAQSTGSALLTITGGAYDGTMRALYAASDATLSAFDARIDSSVGMGVRVESDSIVTIEGSTITAALEGVHQSGASSETTVRRSRIAASGNGVLVTDGTINVEESRVVAVLAAGKTMGNGQVLNVRRSTLSSTLDFGVSLDDGQIALEGSRVTGQLGGAFATRANAELIITTSSIGPSPGIGISMDDGDLALDRSIITGNAGGGLDLGSTRAVSVTNCLISFNGTSIAPFGGVRFRASPNPGVFANNTVVRNRAAAAPGIACASTASVINSIVWSNSPSPGVSTCDVTDSDLDTPRTDNLSVDPEFVDPSGGDFHLRSTSPCIDAGDSGGVPGDISQDLDGDVRIQGSEVDIGADEVR